MTDHKTENRNGNGRYLSMYQTDSKLTITWDNVLQLHGIKYIDRGVNQTKVKES